MRHFLIITCLAALVWANTPVQAALAQEDSSTVESDTEPSPDFDEVKPEVEKPSELPAISRDEKAGDGQSKSPPDADADTKALSDECDPACNSMSGISDPLTILRIAVAPIVLWIVKNLVSYSFQRIHMARAIYVDVEYRLLFAEQCIEAGRRWVEAFDANQNQPRIPILNISREDHRLYTALQPDLRECTWGAEVAAIRLIYRSFDEIENIADRISQTYADLLAASRNLSRAPRGGRSGTNLNRYRDLIEADIDRVERIFAFWLAVSFRAKRGYLKSKLRKVAWKVGFYRASNVLLRFVRGERTRFRWVARSMLYGILLWHLMCAYVPLAILSVVGLWVVFGFPNASNFAPLLKLTIGSLFVFEMFLLSYARKRGEERIKEVILRSFREQMREMMTIKKPPTYV
ncbi:MAG: hypothetical protein RLN89_03835 [Parvibaculum sp.]